MPGPFPGMDPYLERHPGDVHLSVLVGISEQLNERLPPDLVCRANARVESVGGPERPRTPLAPFAAEDDRPAAPRAVPAAEAFVVHHTEWTRRWLEVRPLRDRPPNGYRGVMTVIELLRPELKFGRGLAAYRAEQAWRAAAGVSLVEIDLIRSGGWVLYPERHEVPPEFREPYRLAVTDLRDFTPVSVLTRVRLRRPLPPISVPLRRGEEPVTLDLQPVIDRAWATGRYGTHYRADPPPFPPDDAAWIADRVREWTERHGRAGSSPPADAAAAPADEPDPTGPPAAG